VIDCQSRARSKQRRLCHRDDIERRQPSIHQPRTTHATYEISPTLNLQIVPPKHKMSTDQIIPPMPAPPSMSPESPSTPTHEYSAPMLSLDNPINEKAEEEPLYTEINIPLPRLPSPSSPQPPTSLSPPPQSHSRSRSRSLSLFRPRSISLSSSRHSEDRKSEDSTASSRRVVRNRDIVAAMDLGQKSRGRRGTVDALAVVPTVLVLSAELFTPGEGKGGREGRREVRWEEGIR
jgi:hypothetical protein